MKAHGIVRRIDDLGRIVIPKELRRSMRIKDGDPMEIFSDANGKILLKKYSPLKSISSIAGDYAKSLFETTGKSVLISDQDTFVASSGCKKDYVDMPIGNLVEKVIFDKTSIQNNNDMFIVSGMSPENNHIVYPIMTNDYDCVGAVVIYTEDESIGELEKALCENAANFLGKQMSI